MTNSIIKASQDRQLIVGAAADQFARAGIFEDYQARRAHNTLCRQQGDLATFAEYMTAVQFYARCQRRTAAPLLGPNRQVRYHLRADRGLRALAVVERLCNGHGQPEAFDRQVVRQAGLPSPSAEYRAARADPHRHGLPVQGTQARQREARRRGGATRKGVKRPNPSPWTMPGQGDQNAAGHAAGAARCPPDVPAARSRAARAGAGGARGDSARPVRWIDDLRAPEGHKVQTYELTPDTLRAARAWFASGDTPVVGRLLCDNRKGGKLT